GPTRTRIHRRGCGVSDAGITGTITVNDRALEVTFGPTETLLDLLRRNGHTEVKRGCARGECGSCLVLLDDLLVNSCQVFAATALGRRLVTSVGLARDDRAAEIHRSFARTGAVQCGFCTPAMVMATRWLLERTPNPSDEEIREALAGNLCRCTGYVKTIDAVKLAAERMRSHG
ncbi:MAG: (2Fe-2S)-binding protein, partial [Spirochaetota bacterium]